MKADDIMKLLIDKIEKSTPKELKEGLDFLNMVEIIRQQAKKEVFDDIEKISHRAINQKPAYNPIYKKEHYQIRMAENKWNKLKEKHLNTSNTELEKKE